MPGWALVKEIFSSCGAVTLEEFGCFSVERYIRSVTEWSVPEERLRCPAECHLRDF